MVPTCSTYILYTLHIYYLYTLPIYYLYSADIFLRSQWAQRVGSVVLATCLCLNRPSDVACPTNRPAPGELAKQCLASRNCSTWGPSKNSRRGSVHIEIHFVEIEKQNISTITTLSEKPNQSTTNQRQNEGERGSLKAGFNPLGFNLSISRIFEGNQTCKSLINHKVISSKQKRIHTRSVINVISQMINQSRNEKPSKIWRPAIRAADKFIGI